MLPVCREPHPHTLFTNLFLPTLSVLRVVLAELLASIDAAVAVLQAIAALQCDSSSEGVPVKIQSPDLRDLRRAWRQGSDIGSSSRIWHKRH
jgi:hypothetical protein